MLVGTAVAEAVARRVRERELTGEKVIERVWGVAVPKLLAEGCAESTAE